MESERDKSIPAFPVEGRMYEDALGGQLFHGMTLRDYFAAKALQGMLASETETSFYKPRDAAKKAYHLADAMLKARGEQEVGDG